MARFKKEDAEKILAGARRKKLKITGIETHAEKTARTRKKLSKIEERIRAEKAKAATDAERAKYIRICAICDRFKLPYPLTEVTFDTVRKWRFDYYFTDGFIEIALEVEGGHNQKNEDGSRGGRHNLGDGFLKDMEKYNATEIHGIHLVRIIPKELFYIKTYRFIKALFDKHSKFL